MVHETAGTAGFTGFGREALDELSISLNLDSSYLVAGDLGLAGLSLFMFRPASAGPLLTAYGRKPLRAERPDSTRYRGFVLGEEAGLMAVQPLSDPSRFASGAWFSPAGSQVSAMILAGSEPGHTADGWYETDRVQADRLWGAASLGIVRKGKSCRMFLSGALTGSVGLPGPDGMAARLEALLATKRLRFDAEASLTRGDWRAPDGATAVPVRFDLSGLYRRRGLELSGAYRLVSRSTGKDGLETGIRGHILLGGGGRELKLATTINQTSGQSLPVFTLDTSWRPGLFPVLLPGLVLETSWKASDGRSERMDSGASLKGGRELRWTMDAGLRYDTQGRHLWGAASILVPLGGNSLRFGLKSDGWLPLGGELPEAPLVLSFALNFSGP